MQPDSIIKMDGVTSVIGDNEKFNISNIIKNDNIDNQMYVTDISDVENFNISY